MGAIASRRFHHEARRVDGGGAMPPYATVRTNLILRQVRYTNGVERKGCLAACRNVP